MAFTFRPASRENVGLLIGLSGGTGSGKTYSAFRLAKGIAGDRPFAVIDTEASRAKHYADAFRFDHGDLKPPFRPSAYADAIHAADEAKYSVIVVDSMSHEWAGEDGILDWQEDELQRMAGDDYKKRESCKMAAWIKPKTAHKQMVQRLLQVRAHLILCFRAEPKIEMVRGADGKMEIREKQSLTGLHGWIPICEKNLPYELTASFLLMADKPGVPQPIKLQQQHRALFPLDEPITEASGARLAAWAKGGAATVEAPPINWLTRIHEAGTKAALQAVGKQLNAAKRTMPADELETLRAAYDARLKAIGSTAKQAPAADPVAAGDIQWRPE
jgi:AAA domain